MRPKELKNQLKLCRDDPMWSGHAEISKATLEATLEYISHLERLAKSRKTKWQRARDRATDLLNQNHELEDQKKDLQVRIGILEPVASMD